MIRVPRPKRLALARGEPDPLGAKATAAGVNFAVRAAGATAVDLCLYDARAEREITRLRMPAQTGDVWHGFLPRPLGIHGMIYGYRADGPYDPAAGWRYNPRKLLLDPYGRRVTGRYLGGRALQGATDPDRDVQPDPTDSGPFTWKNVVTRDLFDWGDDRPPAIPWRDTVLYELHVKGFTRQHPDVPGAQRGTYLGLAHPAVTRYLRRLGVTAVELLPIHAFVSEQFLLDKGLANYWGYNTIGFFAPAEQYAIADAVTEFKTMVRALHAAGLEVILDVVFNHTAEGNERGPTLSFRGLDNPAYYRLEGQRHYQNHAGTGNTLAIGEAAARRLVIDSLRYWVEEMHVDGFRFDLAPVLGRDGDRFRPDGAFFRAVQAEPSLRYVKLIAEPWDLGPDGYQVGKFPREWAEWNDRYRDSMRSYWRGDAGMLGEFAERFAGSSDLFRHHGRRPTASVNFVTCHDGFTLYDLVAHNHKHNEANLEENRDGTDNNVSWNSGQEGATSDPAISALRERRMRNFLATLLLSQGVPMLTAGDEFGRSQLGNNNAYCQDNALGWVDWRLAELRAPLVGFVRQLLFIRRQSTGLRRDTFMKGVQQPDRHHKDVSWWHPAGRELTEADWHDLSSFGIGVLVGHAFTDMHGHNDGHVLFICNSGPAALGFTLPKPHRGTIWQLVFDTSEWQPGSSLPRAVADHRHVLPSHSCALLVDGDVPPAIRSSFAALAQP